MCGNAHKLSSLQEEDIRHRATLSWISTVGCLLSLAGILITLLIMVRFWKNMRSPRTTVLVNLCVAIAVTDVLVVTMEIIDLDSKVSVCHLEQTIDTVMKYLNYIKKVRLGVILRSGVLSPCHF